MIKNKMFWNVMMLGALGGWLFAGYGLFFTIESGFLRFAWFAVLITWVVGHPLELVLSIPVAKKAGLSPLRTVIKTMLFGFTWWVPLKYEVIDR